MVEKNGKDWKDQYLQLPRWEGLKNPEDNIGYAEYRHRKTGKIVQAKFDTYFTTDGRQNLFFIKNPVNPKERFMAKEWFESEYEKLNNMNSR